MKYTVLSFYLLLLVPIFGYSQDKVKDTINFSDIEEIHITYHLVENNVPNLVAELKGLINYGSLTPYEASINDMHFNSVSANNLMPLTWSETNETLPESLDVKEIVLKRVTLLDKKKNTLGAFDIFFSPLNSTKENIQEQLTIWFYLPELENSTNEFIEKLITSFHKKNKHKLVEWEFTDLNKQEFSISKFYENKLNCNWDFLDNTSYAISIPDGSYELEESEPINIEQSTIKTANFTYHELDLLQTENKGLHHYSNLHLGGYSFISLVSQLGSNMSVERYNNADLQQAIGSWEIDKALDSLAKENEKEPFLLINKIILKKAILHDNSGKVMIERVVAICPKVNDKELYWVYYPQFKSNLYGELLYNNNKPYINFFEGESFKANLIKEEPAEIKDALNFLEPFMNVE